MSAFKTRKKQIQKLPFLIGCPLLGMLVIQSAFGLIAIVGLTVLPTGLPMASAADTLDKDTYDTLLEESDQRIKDMKKKRREREVDRLKEEAEDRKADDLRQKRPVFGSRKLAGDDSDDSDDSDENKNKIFAVSAKQRDSKRQMNVTIKLDVDDDDQLDSMKPDSVKKKNKEEEKAKAEKERDEDKELRKRREERKAAFDDPTAKPYFVMDWVPSDPDGTSNGGFGVDDGNGRPVPYTLNGFPNLQRNFPWDIGH